MSKRKILWVTPKWPLPASDGARQATCSALKALTNLGEQIDLLSFVDRPIAANEAQFIKQELGLNEVFFSLKARPFGRLTRAFNLIYSTLFSASLPFTVIPFKVNNINKVLSSGIQLEGWTHVVFDGLHSAASFFPIGNPTFLNNVKFIYRAHNLEANLWKQAAKKSAFIAYFPLLLQEKKIKHFEATLLSKCSALATVSNNDLEEFTSIYRVPFSKVIPIGADFSLSPSATTKKTTSSSIQLVFVGSTSWRPNREGLRWFLEEVWPAVSKERQNISLKIAGRGTEKLQSSFNNLQRITFLGEVESLDPIYHDSHAAIVPIFSGSGTRVKAIEASRFGRACISSEIGVDGLPLIAGRSYLRAESKEEWVRVLTEVSSEELTNIGNEAFKALRRDFDTMSAGRALVELLNSI